MAVSPDFEKQGDFLAQFIAAFLVFFSLTVRAQIAPAPQPAPRSGPMPYYGEEFYNQLKIGINGDALKNLLRTVLNSGHQGVAGHFDSVVPTCSGPGCYGHVVLGYDRARQILLGGFYLVPGQGGYGVRDVYCQHVYGPQLFSGNLSPGPGRIPDGRVINTEHTWPQSRFSHAFPDEMQKSDLHHLFPTDSHMNSVRSSYEFGIVTQDRINLGDCPSHFGTQNGRPGFVFQPPVQQRGKTARAILYFSVRYQMALSPGEEATLRQWNKENPPDVEEVTRNNEIQKVQGDRNPFVDYPDLADRIQKF